MSTVYVRNLNEKIKLGPLKQELKEVFEKYGPVIEVLANKGIKKRGQAYIVFENPTDAETAASKLNKFELFQKEIHTALARTESDITVQRVQGDEALKQKKDLRSKKKQTLERRPTGSDVQSKKRKTENPPHNILFIENLPLDIRLESINEIYNDAPGFVEARIFAAKGVAFVEFTDVDDATSAITRQVIFNDTPASVSYANR